MVQGRQRLEPDELTPSRPDPESPVPFGEVAPDSAFAGFRRRAYSTMQEKNLCAGCTAGLNAT